MLVALTLVSGGFSADCCKELNRGSQVVSLSEVNQETIESFFAGESKFILECTRGFRLPLKFLVNSEFLAVKSETSPEIEILKTCYLWYVDGEFLFSTDLEEWKNFQEFFTGNLGISLNLEEEKPVFQLNLDLNQR